MKKIAVVSGSYKTLEEDISFIKYICHLKELEYDVFAVNRSAMFWNEPIKYLVSHHFDWCEEFRRLRMSRGLDMDFITVSTAPHPGVQCVMPNLREGLFLSGSSSLFAVLLALEYGYQRVMVAGVGLMDKYYIQWQEGWKKAVELNHMGINERVRGVSGYPAQILGIPTNEWIEG